MELPTPFAESRKRPTRKPAPTGVSPSEAPPQASANASRRSRMNSSDAKGPPLRRLSSTSASSSASISSWTSASSRPPVSSTRARRRATTSRTRSRRSRGSAAPAGPVERSRARSARTRARRTGARMRLSYNGRGAEDARPVPAERARPPLRARGRRAHLLPRHRSRLRSDRSRHHQERPVPPRHGPALLHAARLPRPDPAHGPSRRRPHRVGAHGRRHGSGGLQGLRGEPSPALPALRARGLRGQRGGGFHHAHRGAGGERGLPEPALPDPPDQGDHGDQGAHLHRVVQPDGHVRGGHQPLPGRPPRASRLRRARSQALARHRGQGRTALHGHQEAARDHALHRRGGERDRCRRRAALPAHRLQPLRPQPAPRESSERGPAHRETREGDDARAAARDGRGAGGPGTDRDAPPRGDPEALHASRGRARLRHGGISPGHPDPARRPHPGHGLEPGHRGRLLRHPHLPRGPGPPAEAARDPGHVAAQCHLRHRRCRPALRSHRGSAPVVRAPARAPPRHPAAGGADPRSPARARPARGGRGSRAYPSLIDRYLVREYLTFIGTGLGVGAVLILVVDLLQYLDRFLRVKPPLLFILQHLFYRLPGSLYEGLPIIVLISTVFLFLSLTQARELDAMKAAGISLYRASLPVLLVALSISLVSVVLQETVLPVINSKAEDVDRVKIRGNQPRHLQRQTPIWYRSSDTRFMRMELLDPIERSLDGLLVVGITPDFRLADRLDARKARWTSEGWMLSDGVYRHVGPGNHVSADPFAERLATMPEQINDLIQVQQAPETMSFRELRTYVTRLAETGHNVGKYLVGLYRKLSFS